MPNSKLAPTKVLDNLVITIGDLLVLILFIMPRDWSALATAVCVCVVNFNSLSTMTPKSLSTSDKMIFCL